MFRKTLLTTTAILFAGGAYATTCDDGFTALGENDEMLANIERADPTTRRNLRNFVNVAQTLNRAGYDEVCESVIEAVKDMSERGSIMTEEARSAAMNEDAEIVDTDVRIGDWDTFDHEEAVGSSVPFSDLAQRVNSDMIVGSDARLMDGEDIGAVDGFLTERGAGVSHLIVGYGGFLNIGDREVAVPVEKVRYNVQERVFYIDATESWFESQPDWDASGWFEEGWTKDET